MSSPILLGVAAPYAPAIHPTEVSRRALWRFWCIGMTIYLLAMAGLMGGGGLGDIAIRYGYYRYNYTIMYYALIILIVLVEVIQTSIGLIVKHIDKRNK